MLCGLHEREAFFRNERPKVMARMQRRFDSVQDAEDAAQDACLEILKGIAKGKVSFLSSKLFTQKAMKNFCGKAGAEQRVMTRANRAWHRQRNGRKHEQLVAFRTASKDEAGYDAGDMKSLSPENEVLAGEFLEQALAEMPLEVKMRCIYGCKDDEIARVCNISPGKPMDTRMGTVRVRRKRWLDKMRARVGPNEFRRLVHIFNAQTREAFVRQVPKKNS